jgi:TonB family protein
MRLDFPFDASPANAYAARRAGGAGAPAPAAPEAVKLDRSALVRVGFILGADGRARSVSITGRDANAEADAALFETEARKFIAASSFETPPDIPRQGLRSSYVVEFTPASVQTAPQAAQTLGPRAWRWARRPTGAELDREFPDRAISARRSGDVTLACLVQPQGTLNCAVVSESPEGYRFGAAALRVVREARVAETFTNGQTAVGQQITVPIRFEYRESPAPRSASNQR